MIEITKHARSERKAELEEAKGTVLGRPAMKEIILWVKMQLMFPDGYAANIKRGASLDKLKIFGLKSLDWHIWI